MLTKIALKNPVAIFMIAIACVVLGVLSFNRIPIDLFPKITTPVVIVGVVYTGAGPRDIESSVTYPIEKAISSVPNVSYIESMSRQGSSVVRAYFNWDADIDVGANDCIQKVQQMMSSLPLGAAQPFVIKFDVSNMPIIGFTVTGGGLDDRELYDLAYNTIVPQLEHIKGVSTASISGGSIRRINVLASRDSSASRDISVNEIVSAIQGANFLMPSGNIKVGVIDYNLYTETLITDVSKLGDVVVKQPKGDEPPVFLRDIARVEDGIEETTNIVSINGKTGLSIMVRKQPGANTVEVVDEIIKALPNFYGVPKGTVITPSFDQSTYIKNSIGSLINEALMGALLSICIIYFFLRTFRSTLIISISIPLSITITFVLLYFLGEQTLNIFTLGGLALGVGRLVDDSIVVLENIYRSRKNFQSAKEAALVGATQVATPVLAATVSTISVFFPVVFLAGVAKQLFVPMVLAIVFSLASSYFVSMTIVPVLCTRFLPEEKELSLNSPKISERILASWGALFSKMDSIYASILTWALKYKIPVAAVMVVLFVLSLQLFSYIGTDFFPKTDESQFRINLRMPIGTRVEETAKATKIIEDTVYEAIGEEPILALRAESGVRSSGMGTVFSGNSGSHASSVSVNLIPPDKRPFSDVEATEMIRKRLAGKLPGAQLFFSQGGMMSRVMNFGSDNAIEIEILGFDFELGEEIAWKVEQIVKNTKGTADVRVSRESNYPELDIAVDREKAAIFGISTREVAQSVLTSMSGNVNTPVLFSDPVTGRQYNIDVRFQDNDRKNLHDLNDVPIKTKTGKTIDLKTVASVTSGVGPVQIDRKNQQRIVRVTANTVDRALGDISEEIEAEIDKLELPQGFSVHMGGQREQQKESFQSLLLAVLLALMLVYMAMAAQFNSLKEPFIVMFSVPMGISGVALTLYLTGTPLSINAYMGIIMMVGVVLSNGILLVDLANRLQDEGKGIVESITEAGRTRLRPILMTTLTTLLGMLPMAIGIGEGSETNVPLARAVVGGLAVSTAFTLILIPILYTFIGKKSFKEKVEA
ncbi:MAG: efflux RND transporter permease subunit [bacterium]